ncbi:MAG: ATP-binding protein [Dehalococcoidia bacterium]
MTSLDGRWTGHGVAWDQLVPALERLDTLLSAALDRAQDVYGPGAALDQFRGLYISETEPAQLLERRAGQPLLWSPGAPATAPFPRLREAFGLSPFDCDVVLLALAPELDRRYERLYAYLQDNVSLRLPAIDLALNLLCADAAERIEQLDRFSPQAPLVAHRLITLADGGGAGLGRTFRLEEQVTSFLLGSFAMSEALAPHCHFREPAHPVAELAVFEEEARAIARALQQDAAGARVIDIHGHDEAGRLLLADGIAASCGGPLLVLDLASLLRSGDFTGLLRLFLQAARLSGAVPCLANSDALAGDPVAARWLAGEVARWPGVTALAGEARLDLPGLETVPVAVGGLDFGARRRLWEAQAMRRGVSLPPPALDDLAARLRLTAGQLDDAVADAWWQAQWRAAAAGESDTGSVEVTVDDLYAAACERSTSELAALSQRLRPSLGWDDIVLPGDASEQLRELCSRVARRRTVLDDWGFGRRLSLGKGTAALFSGPPGTGKTMAAEIVAAELKLDLCKIDLSSIVSKYIGETEKNLNQVFRAAERANAILFFDEADALFGKRSEVRDSHDRYANIEISYLLQKMEEYDGVAILATNLRQNLDESFIRRLAFTIHFPFPDEESRAAIWRTIWPSATPLAADVCPEALARRFKLAGGNIKNIALAAAFLSAEDGSDVTMAHLVRATRREYQKLGKAMAPAELDEVPA